MMIPRFALQTVRGESQTVYGDDTQTGCFCHVRDLRALVGLLGGERAWGGVFNVGDITKIRIVDLARRFIEAAGSGSPIRVVPYEVAYEAELEDMPRWVPDTSRIRDLPGWEPAVSLDEIINEMLAEARASRPGVGVEP